jgi:hypothetical protein
MRSEELLRLLHGGDWACVFNEPTALARVCSELSEHLSDASLIRRALEVAELAGRDVHAATRQWRSLAASLRADPDAFVAHSSASAGLPHADE